MTEQRECDDAPCRRRFLQERTQQPHGGRSATERGTELLRHDKSVFTAAALHECITQAVEQQHVRRFPKLLREQFRQVARRERIGLDRDRPLHEQFDEWLELVPRPFPFVDAVRRAAMFGEIAFWKRRPALGAIAESFKFQLAQNVFTRESVRTECQQPLAGLDPFEQDRAAQSC